MGKELGNKNGRGSWEVRIGRESGCKNGKESDERMGRRVFHYFPLFLPFSLINFFPRFDFLPNLTCFDSFPNISDAE